jgi:hypothetical protein
MKVVIQLSIASSKTVKGHELHEAQRFGIVEYEILKLQKFKYISYAAVVL